MDESEEMPRLRLAPSTPLEAHVEHLRKEQRIDQKHREAKLELADEFRIGSVPYLNSVPLTRGIEHQTTFKPPSELAGLLERDELDAALVSVSEVILKDRYDVLDGVAVASLGEVISVFVAHRIPLEEATEIYCDTASLASVNLLKVLLAEMGLSPELKQLDSYEDASEKDCVLLIGNQAIEFRRADHEHKLWDLGAAWYDLTQLPFVFAVWAIRRGIENVGKLCSELRDAKDFGMDTLDFIISDRTDYDAEFRRDYLGWHIHYHMGSDEKRGLMKFVELLDKHGLGPVYEPKFIV
ncbi:MAG: menaquinone biosynthesis protein [Verrucomicrobiia bacterium]|jgi:chorismate dehydratase